MGYNGYYDYVNSFDTMPKKRFTKPVGIISMRHFKEKLILVFILYAKKFHFIIITILSENLF